MAFLDKTGLQTLTNKLVQGDTIKVSSHRGVTVKNVVDNIERECANVSNPLEYKLENRVAEFKVGQGRDVDASGDVETGYSEIGLKGKTWQNLCGSNIAFTSANDDFFDIEEKDDCIRVTKKTESKPNWCYAYNNTLKPKMLKPNTNYTIILKLTTSSNKSSVGVQFMNGNATNNMGSGSVTRVLGDYFVGKITTKSTFDSIVVMSQVLYINHFPSEIGEWFEYGKNAVVLEGDYTQTPVEELPQYFEGIKSSFEDGVVEIESVGKNLFDVSKFTNGATKGIKFEYKKEFGGILVSGTSTDVYPTSAVTDIYNVEVGKTYVSSSSSKVVNCLIRVEFGDGTVKYGSRFKITNEMKRVSTYLNIHESGVTVNEIVYAQVELDRKTPYEPYVKETLIRELGLPMRSLPNGICDEVKGGEHIQRVGKAVLDGVNYRITGTHTDWSGGDFYAGYTTKIAELQRAKGGTSFYCDILPVTEVTKVISGGISKMQCCWGENYSYAFYVSINKNSLSESTANGANQWLASNPTTIYYELETPIITPIEPLVTTTKPLGTYTIKSDIAPVSTHTVQLNRAGQIERAIVDIAELKNRVDVLENYYDSTFLETQHKLALLGMDYELETEE